MLVSQDIKTSKCTWI